MIPLIIHEKKGGVFIGRIPVKGLSMEKNPVELIATLGMHRITVGKSMGLMLGYGIASGIGRVEVVSRTHIDMEHTWTMHAMLRRVRYYLARYELEWFRQNAGQILFEMKPAGAPLMRIVVNGIDGRLSISIQVRPGPQAATVPSERSLSCTALDLLLWAPNCDYEQLREQNWAQLKLAYLSVLQMSRFRRRWLRNLQLGGLSCVTGICEVARKMHEDINKRAAGLIYVPVEDKWSARYGWSGCPMPLELLGRHYPSYAKRLQILSRVSGVCPDHPSRALFSDNDCGDWETRQGKKSAERRGCTIHAIRDRLRSDLRSNSRTDEERELLEELSKI